MLYKLATELFVCDSYMLTKLLLVLTFHAITFIIAPVKLHQLKS